MMGIAALNPSYVLSHSRVQASRFLLGESPWWIFREDADRLAPIWHRLIPWTGAWEPFPPFSL